MLLVGRGSGGGGLAAYQNSSRSGLATGDIVRTVSRHCLDCMAKLSGCNFLADSSILTKNRNRARVCRMNNSADLHDLDRRASGFRRLGREKRGEKNSRENLA